MSENWFTKYELPTIRRLVNELNLHGQQLSTLVHYCRDLSNAMDDPHHDPWDMLVCMSRRDRYINELLTINKLKRESSN